MVVARKAGKDVSCELVTTYSTKLQDAIGCDVTDLKHFSFIERSNCAAIDSLDQTGQTTCLQNKNIDGNRLTIDQLVGNVLSSESRLFAVRGNAYFVDPILEKEDSNVTLKFIISYFRPDSKDLLLGLQTEPRVSEK